MRSDTRKKYVALLVILLSGLALYVNWEQIAPLFSFRGAEGDSASPGDRGKAAALGLFNTSHLTVPVGEIHSGGPGKDGIPSLSHPETVGVAEMALLAPEDRVVGVEFDGQSRAYPIRLLNWHELINDQVGDTPVAIVYCPLCDSVSALDRRIDNRTLDFGISGLLHNSNVLFYDRSDNALWSQVSLEAISGPLAGRSLRHLPFSLTTFAAWRETHPDSTVATFETDHPRDYERNPYARYFESDELMFPVKGTDQSPFRNKEPVVGVRNGNEARAYPVSTISDTASGQVEDTLGGEKVILEARKTGTHVQVISVPEGAQVVHTFWFAWKAFHPDTTIYTPESN